uniref:Uncharacterized protein n=1 Tax=Haptolina brevifila TaxID=156173 RepID=A0A7S2DHN9_9EUKA
MERCVTLVLLCEHLLSTEPEFRGLQAAVDSAAKVYRNKLSGRSAARAAYHKRTDTDATQGLPLELQETWPGEGGQSQMQFLIAPAAPNAATRWVRKLARLPPASTGSQNLAPLIVDLRIGRAHCSYAMRGVCEIEEWPDLSASMLCADAAKRLSAFIELFCRKMQPPPGVSIGAPRGHSVSSPYHGPRVCTEIV